jgi:hypothetical protein
MSDLLSDIVENSASVELLIDTNLLLLYFVGAYDPSAIPRFKRTQQFLPVDHATLIRVMDRFAAVVTTPHILTEVSNLLGQLSGAVRNECFSRFGAAIPMFRESYEPSVALAPHSAFQRLGLTDVAILAEAVRKCVVLTDDVMLYSFLSNAGRPVLNFNHIRAINW